MAGSTSGTPSLQVDPLPRRTSSIAASTHMDSSTPAVKAMACLMADSWDSRDCSTRLTILRDSTGNTHGMRFRMSPPRNANNRATGTVMELVEGGAAGTAATTGAGSGSPAANSASNATALMEPSAFQPTALTSTPTPSRAGISVARAERVMVRVSVAPSQRACWGAEASTTLSLSAKK